MCPDTCSALRIKTTVSQCEFLTGIRSENMKKKKEKKICRLSETVNGDFVSLLYVFSPFFFLFFFFAESKTY